MPIFYVHRNSAQAVFVKTAACFKQQGGLSQPWGRAWRRLVARNLTCARELANKRLLLYCAPALAPKVVKSGLEMIREERERQIHAEGYDAKHDDKEIFGQLCLAAVCYASPFPLYVQKPLVPQDQGIYFVDPWPWKKSHDKRVKHGRLRQLAIAGALIAAEIDRLQRGGATA